MKKPRNIELYGTGCKIMIGDREIIRDDASWSFSGVVETTWWRWFLLKMKNILKIKPTLYADTIHFSRIDTGGKK